MKPPDAATAKHFERTAAALKRHQVRGTMHGLFGGHCAEGAIEHTRTSWAQACKTSAYLNQWTAGRFGMPVVQANDTGRLKHHHVTEAIGRGVRRQTAKAKRIEHQEIKRAREEARQRPRTGPKSKTGKTGPGPCVVSVGGAKTKTKTTKGGAVCHDGSGTEHTSPTRVLAPVGAAVGVIAAVGVVVAYGAVIGTVIGVAAAVAITAGVLWAAWSSRDGLPDVNWAHIGVWREQRRHIRREAVARRADLVAQVTADRAPIALGPPAVTVDVPDLVTPEEHRDLVAAWTHGQGIDDRYALRVNAGRAERTVP